MSARNIGGVLLLAGFLLLGGALLSGGAPFGPSYGEAADRATAVVSFSSRLAKSSITSTDISEDMIRGVQDVAREEFCADIVDCPKLVLIDQATQAQQIAEQHRAELDTGNASPGERLHADYELQGFVTMLSNVKAQSGVLMLSGKDKTVYVELSLRVIDRKSGMVVFTATADSRRKSELSYHAVVHRADSGLDGAVEQAVSDAVRNLAADLLQAM